jgi:hypothetical protein
MNIKDYMRSDSPNSPRLSAGNCWMYWDDTYCEWVVMIQKYGTSPRVLWQCEAEIEAIEAMRRALGEIE